MSPILAFVALGGQRPTLDQVRRLRQIQILHRINAARQATSASQDATPPHEIHLAIGRDVAPGPKVQLNINTRNVSAVHLDARPVDAEAWLVRRDLPDLDLNKWHPAPTGGPVRAWDISVRSKGQALNPRDNYFSRQVNVPPLRPGVYLITVSGAGAVAYGVVNVTNLAVVIKRSSDHLLAWVTDFKTHAYRRSASVAFVTKAREKVGKGHTGADGVVLMRNPRQDGVLIVRYGDEVAGIRVGFNDPDGTLHAHFETDRPIYRPGQTISFKAILRAVQGRTYRALSGATVTVRLRDARDNPVDEVPLYANAMGTVSGSFRIPQEGVTGPYSLVLQYGDQHAYQTFTVAAYRKPEFKVDVTPGQRRYLAGDKLRFTVNASYYFGAPVAQAHIRWIARSSGMPFFTRGEYDRWFYGGDGNLYPRDEYATPPFLGEGEAVTDNDGRATIELDSVPNSPDQQCDLTVTVEDSSRRQVSAEAGVPVYSANVRVGLTSPASVTPLGKLIPLQINAEDLDGHAVAADVRLRLIQQVYDDKANHMVDHVLNERTVHVPSSGKLMTELPALAEGDLRIVATAPDGAGRTARTVMSAYVVGPFEKIETQPPAPQITLRSDRRIYAPGDRATIYASTTRPLGPMLVVLEGRDIFDYAVLGPGKRNRQWSAPLSVAQSPNAYVTACEWCEGSDVSSNIIIPVPDPATRLTVTATPDRKVVEPGERQRIQVHATDSRGRPARAEVAMSVVEEAIYALAGDSTPDPYGFYWGLRGDLVETGTSAPEELEGGAFQRTNSIAPIRQRFEDTAYWNPTLETGPDGSATAEFEVPGNLTTWRTTIRGVTLDTAVGSSTSSFMATRGLTLRMAVPTRVAQGDAFDLIGTLNNRTGRPLEERVFLRPEGVTADHLDQNVTVPARGEATVKWHIVAPTVPVTNSFKLTARAEGPSVDVSDAVAMTVPIVPRGVRDTLLAAGNFEHSATVDLTPMPDAIPDGAHLEVHFFAGMAGVAADAARAVLTSPRYGSPAAADALVAGSAAKLPPKADEVREALALLSRTQHPDGWGWWEDSPSNAVITAQVGHALAVARQAGFRIYDPIWDVARNGAWTQFTRTNLWEYRALLAAAMLELDRDDARASVDEVRERGINLSPFARLRIAEALTPKDRTAATEIVESVLPLVTQGPGDAMLPVGEGLGWTATGAESTAELLTVLVELADHADLQRSLANHLALASNYRSVHDQAAVARALALYGAAHPAATNLGYITAALSDHLIGLTPPQYQTSVSATWDLTLPLNGPLRITRTGDGEVLYSATLRYYRRSLGENVTGIRVARRYEVKSEAGIWTELRRIVRPGEPVRCTVMVWGDDYPDAIRVTEPIPTGFQFVDADRTSGAFQDVRDGEVLHYIPNAGAPSYFRYYLRPETDGRMIALPAIAECLRRPAERGQSAAQLLEVGK